MHEYAITSSIIEIVKENIKGKDLKSVKSINFEIKKFSHIEPESIRFYYGFLTDKEPVLKGAQLRFEQKGLKVKCIDCGKESVQENLVMQCADCGTKNVKLMEEDDLRIISLEIE